MTLVRAIAAGDTPGALRLLAASPALAIERVEVGATREVAAAYHLDTIGHYVYAGDTPLHIAAAAYQREIAHNLIAMGANVRSRNRRGAEPLHYAADGNPGSRSWDPAAQADTIGVLIEAGAAPNAVDKSGVMPLHRAVRTRCASAVRTLLDGGADPSQERQRLDTNGPGDAQHRSRRLRFTASEGAATGDHPPARAVRHLGTPQTLRSRPPGVRPSVSSEQLSANSYQRTATSPQSLVPSP